MAAVRQGHRTRPSAKAAIGLAALALAAPSAEAAQLTRGPYLQLLTTQSVTIVWNTDTAAACSLAIRPLGGATALIGGGTGTVCAIPVAGLSPGAQYGYTPRADGVSLGSETVFQADDPTLPYTFLVVGDTGDGGSAQFAVRDRMVATPADFILHTGDMIYDDGLAADFNPKFFTPYASLIRHLVIWPSLGNHDVRTASGQPWRDAFYTPANNAAGSENYYSFDFGNSHTVVLNSNASTSPGSAQYVFLDQDLGASRALWKFVAFHHPVYSSSQHGSSTTIRNNLVPLFDTHAVDIVFMGHDHDYERTKPLRNDSPVTPGTGTVYITTGGGGRSLYPAGTSSFTAYSESSHHFTRVAVDGGMLVEQMIRVDGAVRDSMTLLKDGSATTTTRPPTTTTSTTRPPTTTTTRPPTTTTSTTHPPTTTTTRPPTTTTSTTRPPTTTTTRPPTTTTSTTRPPTTTTTRPPTTTTSTTRPTTTTTTTTRPPTTTTTTSSTTTTTRPARVVPAAADTFVEAGRKATWDHGVSDHLDVYAQPFGITYLKFDLRGLAGPVVRATLTLFCSNGSPDGGTVYLVPESHWIEGTGDGNDAGSADGPGLKWSDLDTNADVVIDERDSSPFVPEFRHPIARLGSVSAGRAYTVDVTRAFQGGPGLYTVAISNGILNGASFSSREHAAAAQRPVLRFEEGADLCVEGDGQGSDASSARVRVSRLGSSTQTLKITASFVVPLPFAPPLDPLANGVRLALRDRFGDAVASTTVPGGAFDGRSGWKVNRAGDRWLFRDRNAPALHAGIARIILQDESDRSPGLVQIVVSARNGSYAATPGSTPFNLMVELNAAVGGGTASQCSELAFAPDQCTFGRNESRVQCR